MKKNNTAPISGMQELLPNSQAIFNEIKGKIERVYHSHGFQSIETPIIDRTSILLAKAGGDTEKQIYKVIKTSESAEQADQALRFDHTVPLARYVVEHQNELHFPFKVTQIGRNFRGERAQKGRFREFYQLDIDVIGREELSLEYDVEVVATAIDAIKSFLDEKICVRLSNRKILSGLLDELELSDLSDQIFSIIDHAEKVTPESTHQALLEVGISDAKIKILKDFINIRGSRSEVIKSLSDLNISNPAFKEGLSELNFVMELLEMQGFADSIAADMLIIRGLDYYTGSVFETILPNYRSIGSVCSGGRYENLTSNFSDQKMPGVGISIGLTRLFSVLNEYQLLKTTIGKPIDVAIIPFSSEDFSFSYQIAKKLRNLNQSVDIIFLDKKLKNKLNHAAKIANHLILIGEEESKTGLVKVKNLDTGNSLSFEEYISLKNAK